MQGMINWDDLRLFLTVQRHGAHAGAARALGVDPTTVGRRVAQLEERLGARLLRRTRSGLVATDAGVQLAAHAERIEAEVLASERAVGGADRALGGTVRITSGDGIVTYVLMPALSALLGAHPGLRVELRGDVRVFDLSRREADVALRLVRPREATLVARRLGTARFGLFATESYLARRGRPATEEALAEHDLIGWDRALDDVQPMQWLLRRTSGDIRVRANTTAAIVAACVAGNGIGVFMTAAARGYPGLVPLLTRVELPTRDVWGVVHTDVRRHPRVVAVMRWAETALAAAGMR
jgi:DNA-binding transcriptional LysR family regulator